MRKLRFVLPILVVLLAIPAATAHAVARMPVGFFDDPSFRWSEDAKANLLQAQRAHTSIVHVLAYWSSIAKSRPKNPLNGSDPAYDLSDLDQLVISSEQYGFEVLMTIAGTPAWANGGKTPNYPPTNMNDLKNFAQMLATRYNGKNARFGVVTRFSIWNEPNLQLFLAPQFDKKREDRQPGDLRQALHGGLQRDQGRQSEGARGGGRDLEPRPQPPDRRRQRLHRACDVRAAALRGEPEAPDGRVGDAPVPERLRPRPDAAASRTRTSPSRR